MTPFDPASAKPAMPALRGREVGLRAGPAESDGPIESQLGDWLAAAAIGLAWGVIVICQALVH